MQSTAKVHCSPWALVYHCHSCSSIARRRRRVQEPEVLDRVSDEEGELEDDVMEGVEDGAEDEEELDEEEIERRRAILKARARQRALQQEEVRNMKLFGFFFLNY